MASNLPFVPSLNNYRFSTKLESTQYVFDVYWNDRDNAWHFDISDATAAPIAYGLKVVLGTIIGRTITDARFPTGIFLVADTSSQGLDAGYDDLGARIIVQYISVTELLSLGVTG